MKKNRCYLRGFTLLGLFNTLIGCLINRVLVRCIDLDSRKVSWRWDKATNHPQQE